MCANLLRNCWKLVKLVKISKKEQKRMKSVCEVRGRAEYAWAFHYAVKIRQNPSKSVEFAVNGVCLCQNRLGYQKRFFRLIRNIPGTDPTNPERYYVPAWYLVGTSRRRSKVGYEDVTQSGEEGSAQTSQTQIRKPFRIRVWNVSHEDDRPAMVRMKSRYLVDDLEDNSPYRGWYDDAVLLSQHFEGMREKFEGTTSKTPRATTEGLCQNGFGRILNAFLRRNSEQRAARRARTNKERYYETRLMLSLYFLLREDQQVGMDFG